MKRAFVIAMECEAEAVRPALRDGDRLYVSGIGKVNAAAATQLAICEGADEIWNAGLCGGFGDVEVGGIYGVERAVEYDFDLAKLNGTAVGVLDEMDAPYLPFGKIDGAACRCALFRGWRTLATGDRFNDGEADYDLITRRLGASLRDMEGAAIAHVCMRRGVPCRSFKCVTNVAGAGSMTGQYRENMGRCLASLEAAAKSLARP
ncbi:MAG: 5'-methylthioadenosine/S-adenosylhomocysteine nucleosidase [Kiritimatiellae bacterium]|nr:5'-methylthioadenosine/S-adenosylhomocysteine nucleosidase [Kiritimatiellia bacterium]